MTNLKDKVLNQKLEIIEINNEKIQLEHKIFALVAKLNQEEKIFQSINSELYEIHESTAWKLVQKLWKIRILLAPIGSKRDKLLKIIKKFFISKKHIIKAKNLEFNHIQNFSQNIDVIGNPKGETSHKSKNNIYENNSQIRQINLEKFLNYTKKEFPESHFISHIMFLPLLSIGGAENVAKNFIKLLDQNNPDNSVLLIITDKNLVDSSASMGTNAIVLNLEEFIDSSDRNTKKIFIFDIIKLIRPAVIHNINSSIVWEMIIEKGKELQNISKIFANIFAFQFDENGGKIGFAASYLSESFPYLDGLFSDNKRFIDDAIIEYNLQNISDKLFTIYTPSQTLAENELRIIINRLDNYPQKVKQKERLRSVWAGRLDEEKRWRFFLSLVEKAKNVDFEIFGKSVIDKDQKIPLLPNFDYRGVFTSSKKVFLENDFDVFIFTSRWEGLPNILLEAGLFGVPIIAPVVGGVLELVNQNTGFPLQEKPSLEDYIQALDYIKSYPEEAARRAKNMMNLILERHTWAKFSQEIENILGYIKY